MAKNQISRRTFIKGLAAGAASVATLGVLFFLINNNFTFPRHWRTHNIIIINF